MDETPQGTATPLRNPAVIALFVATAAIYLWVTFVTGPSFERAAGVAMPDWRISGYTPADVVDLHDRVKASPEAAAIANHMYRTLDFVFPALLALSITVLAAAGLRALGKLGAGISAPLARIAAAAISVPYLVLDLRENGLARALFSPPSLEGDTPASIAGMLPVMTSWKFATLSAAILIVVAIWIQVWIRARKAKT